MTEAEWLACEDPLKLLESLFGKASERKLRLFAVSSFRRNPDYDTETWSRALSTAERQADDQLGEAEAADARPADHDQAYESRAIRELVGPEAWRAATLAFHWTTLLKSTFVGRIAYGRPQELLHQFALLCDIFGNPFRSIAFAPAWLTSTVLALANLMYESRDFSAMPILADALQDAGCDSADVLDHCRDTKQTHVRGCWVVDLVLGKS
jgi:hypothetical protein